MKYLSQWSTLAALVVVVGTIVGAYFNGIGEARDYTDKNIGKIEEKLDQVYFEQKTMGEDIAVIKSLVQERAR